MFHAVSVWPVCCQLRPFVRLLIPWYPLVCRAPAEFDRNSRPPPADGRNALPCLKGIPLARARLVRAHPNFGSLLGGVCIDGAAFVDEGPESSGFPLFDVMVARSGIGSGGRTVISTPPE